MLKKKVLSMITALALALSAMGIIASAETTPNYLTFTAEQAGSKVVFGYNSGSMQYRTGNGTTWGDWQTASLSSRDIILANVGDSVQFKGQNVTTELSNPYHFDINTGRVAASGDVTSLTNGVGGDVELSDNCYIGMFYNCTALSAAPNLPSTTLATKCYYFMFDGCTALKTTPALPANKMEPYCYFAMFSECYSLTTIPTLPATQLAEYCYASMFEGTYISVAPELPATTMAPYCYQQMFKQCFCLVKAPELPAKALAEGCYKAMFYDCEFFTTAPELPATELKYECYCNMFGYCSVLTAAPELPAEKMAAYCYYDMFSDCTALTEAPALPATELADNCYCYMFENCTSLTKVPELKATTLTGSCYFGMFSGCTGLNFTTENKQCGSWSLPSDADTSAGNCIAEMFYGVSGIDTEPVPGKIYYYNEDSIKFFSDAAFSITPNGYWEGTLQYSTDGTTWNNVDCGTSIDSSTGSDAVLYFRGKGNTLITGSAYSQWSYKPWQLTPTDGHYISVKGNIMTLLDYENPNGEPIISSDDFYNSKYRDTYYSYNDYLSAMGVLSEYDYGWYEIAASYNYDYSAYLSSCRGGEIQLAEKAFAYMFAGQTSLINLPNIPANKLANNCYEGMFAGCTGIRIGTEDMGLGSWSGIPSGASGADFVNDETYMFSETSGSFTGTPEIGKTYYYEPYEIINCNPEDNKEYHHGYVSVKSGALAGDKVTVEVVPNDGYEIKTLTYEDDTEHSLTVTGNTASFTMPMSTVYVKATFAKIIYSVTCATCENGSVSADKQSAGKGDIVTVTATPSKGYELDKVYVNGEEISGNTFTMPATLVTLYATFKLPAPSFADITSDSGYYADSITGTDKSGIIAFTSVFSNLATDFEDYTFGDEDKFGIVLYNTADGIENSSFECSSTGFDALKEANSYFYSFVSDIAEGNFSKSVYAIPYAKIAGTTYWGSFTSATVNADKWLGSKAANSPIND